MELSQFIDQDWDPESLAEDVDFSQIGDSEDEGPSLPARNVLATLPTLAQGLALLYLSSCILNLPVFMGDFLEWANDGDLPYKDVHNVLPRDMWDRLLVPSKILMPSRRQLLAVHLVKATLARLPRLPPPPGADHAAAQRPAVPVPDGRAVGVAV